MNVSELRLGNWVNYTDNTEEERPGQVTEILTFRCRKEPVTMAKCCYWKASSFLKLTEEWMLRFGFQLKKDYLNNHFWWHPNIHIIEFRNNHFVYPEWDYVNLYYIHFRLFPKTEYVHQLQNQFHSLTGFELITCIN